MCPDRARKDISVCEPLGEINIVIGEPEGFSELLKIKCSICFFKYLISILYYSFFRQKKVININNIIEIDDKRTKSSRKNKTEKNDGKKTELKICQKNKIEESKKNLKYFFRILKIFFRRVFFRIW